MFLVFLEDPKLPAVSKGFVQDDLLSNPRNINCSVGMANSLKIRWLFYKESNNFLKRIVTGDGTWWKHN